MENVKMIHGGGGGANLLVGIKQKTTTTTTKNNNNIKLVDFIPAQEGIYINYKW